MKKITMAIGAVSAFAFAYVLWPTLNTSEQQTQLDETKGTTLATVIVPETFSSNATIGLKAFEAKCKACHAENGAGQKDVAPPLVHKIYEPNHHGDESFQRAAALGVRSHHWPFGDMPPVEGVTRGDVKMIVAYIRELQQANGIN